MSSSLADLLKKKKLAKASSHISALAQQLALLFASPAARLYNYDILVIVVNPVAGKMKRSWWRRAVSASVTRLLAQNGGAIPKTIDWRFIRTHRSGEAQDSAETLARQEGNYKKLLFISVGGDGTHREVINGIHRGSTEAKHGIVRLPAGTGNDYPSAQRIDQVYRLFCTEQPKPIYGLRFSRNGTVISLCYNIASFGLDAVVTHVATALKPYVPSSIYQLAADLVVFFFTIFGVKVPALVKTPRSGESQQTLKFHRKIGMLVWGVDGPRTYGHLVPVLPDEHNIVGIGLGALHTMMETKAAVYRGEHLARSNVQGHRLDEGELYLNRRTPAQFDGEPVILQGSDQAIQVQRFKAQVLSWQGKLYS